MISEALCTGCSGRPPLIFDVWPSPDKPGLFTVFAYCDCGRVYEHEFAYDGQLDAGEAPRFLVVPLSRTQIQITDALERSPGFIHEFDLEDDDVYCDYHDEADGYDLPAIKQDIAERDAAFTAKPKT